MTDSLNQTKKQKLTKEQFLEKRERELVCELAREMTKRFIREISEALDMQIKDISGIKAPNPDKKLAYQELLDSISKLRGRPLYYPYVSSGLGRGPFVKLLDESVKLDFVCGIGPHILGHCHPDLVKTNIRAALEDTVIQGHLQLGWVYHKLLKKLITIAGRKSSLAQAWFAPSGSMVNENALKVIRQKHKGARKILAFERAFAGRTTLMCEITDNPSIKQGLPTYDEVLRVPFSRDNPKQALKVLKQHWDKEKDNISCFMMELFQGDGGYFLADRSFFVPLLEFCKKKGIAVWFDEIQTFGRSGEFFAFEKLDLGSYVDVCTIGKTFQMSASLWTKEYNPKPGLVSGTFSSSGASFHSALVVLEHLEQAIKTGRIEKIAKNWESALKQLEKESLLSDIEGWGLMWGATPCKSKPQEISKLLQILFQKGLIGFSCGQGSVKRLRFLLPAILEESHIKQAQSLLRESLLEIKKQ